MSSFWIPCSAGRFTWMQILHCWEQACFDFTHCDSQCYNSHLLSGISRLCGLKLSGIHSGIANGNISWVQRRSPVWLYSCQYHLNAHAVHSLAGPGKGLSQPGRVLIKARVSQVLCSALVEVIVQHRSCTQEKQIQKSELQLIKGQQTKLTIHLAT